MSSPHSATITVVSPSTSSSSSPARHRWSALAVLMLPVLLISVDNTVLSFALPDISRALQPSGTALLWIVDAYPLVLAGLLISMGSLGDRFGRRRLLIIGSIGFAAVSAAAAFAPSTEWLIAARAALGFFGAMLMPSTLSLLRNIFVDRNQRRLAIAIWATGFAIGAALGPIVGGVLLEHFWWGSIFLLAVPVLIPLVVLTPFLIPESKDPFPGRIDVISILLTLTTMAPVVYAIKAFASDGVSVVGIAALLVGVVSGVVFVRRQLRRPEPMIDMELFRSHAFSVAVSVNLLRCIAFVGFLFFVSQHLQLVLGLSPINAGLVLVPGLLAMMVASLGVVPVSRRIRPGIVIPVALAISAVGYLVVALAEGPAPANTLLVAFAVLGFGIGAAETVSNELIIASAPARKAGAAAAVSETAYEVGAVLGTAILGSILTASYRGAITIPAGLTDAEADAARETLGGASELAEGLPAGLANELLRSATDAFGSGIALTSGIGVLLIVGAAIVATISLRSVGVELGAPAKGPTA
jgi:DHA2 family multidrug resistance protein-like MFS transporter